MKRCGKWPIGVCSWSLGNDLQILNKLKAESGIEHIHLALKPAINNESYLEDIPASGWAISATMIDFPQEDYSTLDSIRRTGGIIPDYCWESNRGLVQWAVEATSQLEVKYLELHFGFIDLCEKDYAYKLLDRAKEIGDIAGESGVKILFETGQETVGTLRKFLEMLNHPALAVNFDPANMILYGKGNPVEAVDLLGTWIKHVHIKDAISSPAKDNWGSEVVWGSGEVGQDAFLNALERNGFTGTLSIEREAGRNRVEDIQTAVNQLSRRP
jgi:sugar phosphate isomerase/epimerase